MISAGTSAGASAGGSPTSGGRLPSVSPATFRRLCLASMVMVVVIVATGAAVRLSGSGLGCPDWPSCYQHRLTAQLSFHPLIEFGNRMITVLVTVVVAATMVGSLLRRPFRRDLVWLSGAMVAGVLVQAVLGGIVVYTKLNPYVVMIHFLASMPLVAVGVVLLHRCSRAYGSSAGTVAPTARSGRLLVPLHLRRLAWLMMVLLGVVLAAGAATTGAGPHAGSSQGQQVAKRLPIALRDMAELHSSLALLFIGVAVGLAMALHATDVPERVRRAARMLVIVLTAQAAVGYTQYFTHLPVALVEVHVIGAAVLVVGSVQFMLALTHHPFEAETLAGGGGGLRFRGAAPPGGPQRGSIAPAGPSPGVPVSGW